MAIETHRKIRIIVIWTGLLVGLSIGARCVASDRVLVVYSYHQTYEWVQDIHSSIQAVLGGLDVELKAFYMDTKRHSTVSWKRQAAQNAKALIRTFEPRVIIAVDDNAQFYLARSYVDHPSIQVVFCGVNAEPEKYGYPASNVTGILERTYPAQTLKVLKTLMPSIRGIAVVTDDSTTAKIMRPRILDRIGKLAPGINLVEYETPDTFSNWMQVISRLDQDPRVDALLVPLYHTVRRDGDDTSVASKDVMRWTLAHTGKPVVGLWPSIIEHGALLAVTVDPSEHGLEAARMTKEILSGKSAAEIPIRTNTDGYVMVNLRDNAHFVFDATVQVDQIADLVVR